MQQLEVKDQEQESSGNVSADAEVRDSKVLGTVEGSPKVYQSFVGEKAKKTLIDFGTPLEKVLLGRRLRLMAALWWYGAR